MDSDVIKIYRRLLKAKKKETGLRLDAYEVQVLSTMDGAIETILSNLEFEDELEDGSVW